MVDTVRAQKNEESLQRLRNATIFQRSQSEVGQDSIADTAIRIGSRQPASNKQVTRGARVRTKPVQTKTVIVEKSRTEPTTIHIEPILKQQLRTLAAGQTGPKLTSLSGIAVALIKRGLFAEPDKPYGPSLEPVVQGAIDKAFTRHDNRLAALQARDTRDSAQTLYLLVQIVSLLLEVVGSLRRETVEPDAFDQIIHASEQHARQALIHPDPYLLELVKNLYFADGGKEEPAV
jgi:hypothetical protein